MNESLKCLHCGHQYQIPVDSKQDVKERICPKCKSNSVRKISAEK